MRKPARGFTMVELMIVVALIGLLSSLAIPGYQKLTARSRRSEMVTAISKFKFFFKNQYDNTGSFKSNAVGVGLASLPNPDPALAPLGMGAPWDSSRTGWSEMPFGLDGSIRMRYAYVVVADNEIRFEACAQFPAFGPATIHCGDGTGVGNYYYTETMKAVGTSVTSNVVEIPTF